MINFTHQLFQGVVRSIRPSFRQKLGLIAFCAALILPFGVQPLLAAETLPPNNVPVATTDVFTIDEDTQLNGNVLTNDHDPDGDAIHTKNETINTSHGTVVIKEDGTFTYTPNANFQGEDKFDYQICDDGNPVACCHGTVKITVVAKQDPPTANPDAFTTNEDTKLDVPCNCVLDNDTDPDGDPLTAVLVTTTQHGTLVFKPDGKFTYMPDLNYNGIDTFTYVANDGTGNSNETVVTITVVPVNDPPIAAPDVAITDEDVAIAIAVLANDTDVDDVLKGSMIVIVKKPTHGTAVVNTSTGNVNYTPSLNYYGSDSFTYKLKDSGGAFSNVVTVSITVNPVNDLPFAAPDQATTPEDVAVNIPVLSNDTDADNAIDASSVTVKTNPANGSVAVQPDGSFKYTPNKDWFGTDTFTYTIKDVGGATSLPGTVTVIVTPVNDAPVAVNDAATTNENTAVAIPVLANDFDVDSPLDPSSITIGTNVQHGSISINTTTGIVTYTPALDYVGDDSFTYTIKDSGGLVSNVATVSISVVNVNRAPVAVDDQVELTTVAPVSIDVLANDYDPDGDELSIISVTNPSKGSVKIENGEIIFTPEGTVAFTTSFSYKISDPGGLTDEAIVTINYSIEELIISQGFSPNGDGNNDTWYMKGIESYPNNIVKVFDRYGIQVYQKSGYENTIAPWDGRGNVGQMAGKLVERGTYFYILEPGNGMKRLEGYVVVIR
jgi:large repetitive protein